MSKVPKRRRKIAENSNHVSRVHERYKRQTDRRTYDDIANVAKNTSAGVWSLPVSSIFKDSSKLSVKQFLVNYSLRIPVPLYHAQQY